MDEGYDLVIDLEDENLCVYENNIDGKIYYSDLEVKALLNELKKIDYHDVVTSYDRKKDIFVTYFDDGKVIYNNFSSLCKIKFFKELGELLRNRNQIDLIKSQKEKLQKRKSHKINRKVAFAMAILLSTPLMIGSTYQANNTPNYVTQEYSIDDLDEMVLQGICAVGDYTFITAYDSSDNCDNSVIYILNEDNECIKTTTLQNDSHVGGICYDSNHNMFWITDKGGTISGYNYDDIVDSEDVCYPKYSQVDVGSKDLINYVGTPSASYIAYHDNSIYVGNFVLSGNGILKKFSINDDGTIDLDSCRTSKFFNRVQGISFYEEDDDTYLIVSSSFGRNIDSSLRILKYDEDCDDYTKVDSRVVTMPSMMEQISFDSNGNLMTLYESNAKKYQGILNSKLKKSSDVIVTDINKIIR